MTSTAYTKVKELIIIQAKVVRIEGLTLTESELRDCQGGLEAGEFLDKIGFQDGLVEFMSRNMQG